MTKLKQIWSWLTIPYKKYKLRKQLLKELREQDPFIYK